MSLRQWTLHKDAEKYVFRCAPGDEGRLLAAITAQAGGSLAGLSRHDFSLLVRTILESIPPGESAVAALRAMGHSAAHAESVRAAEPTL